MVTSPPTPSSSNRSKGSWSSRPWIAYSPNTGGNNTGCQLPMYPHNIHDFSPWYDFDINVYATLTSRAGSSFLEKDNHKVVLAHPSMFLRRTFESSGYAWIRKKHSSQEYKSIQMGLEHREADIMSSSSEYHEGGQSRDSSSVENREEVATANNICKKFASGILPALSSAQ